MVAKYRNAGQTCVSASRVMVQSGVYEEFLSRVREAMAKLVIGDGLKPGVTIGPLINQSQLEKVHVTLIKFHTKLYIGI